MFEYFSIKIVELTEHDVLSIGTVQQINFHQPTWANASITSTSLNLSFYEDDNEI